MDRLVWCILLLATSSLLLDLSRMAAYAKDAEMLKVNVKENSAIPEKEVEVFKEYPSDTTTEKSQKTLFPPGNRNEFFDNIFNIPIATLQAVNNLVQSITGNVQRTGRSYFSGKLQRTHSDHSVPEDKERN